jgi:hypothetical protein
LAFEVGVAARSFTDFDRSSSAHWTLFGRYASGADGRASAKAHFGNAIDHRLICSMVVIEKIDFIPFQAKNNVPIAGRRP